MVVLSTLLALGSACGSRTSNVLHDAAVDSGFPGSGGTGSTTATGSGGATVPGTGGATVTGTGGATVVGSGGIATGGTGMGGTGSGGVGAGGGGNSGSGGVGAGGGGISGTGGGGAGGTGTKLDGGTPVTDSGADKNVPSDSDADDTISGCESVGDTCVATVNGCVACPTGFYARNTRVGCPSSAWCCTQDVPSSNPCTRSGGICSGIFPPCPDGWTLMRTECDTASGAMCCAPASTECSGVQPPRQSDAGSDADASLPSGSLEGFCGAMCDERYRCGSLDPNDQTRTECIADCVFDWGPSDVYREDVFAAIQACLANLDCSRSIDECNLDGANVVSSDPENHPLVTNCMAKAATCKGSDNPWNDDLCLMGLFMLESLKPDFNACMNQPCEEVRACFDVLRRR
jgi:hypothetical protein